MMLDSYLVQRRMIKLTEEILPIAKETLHQGLILSLFDRMTKKDFPPASFSMILLLTSGCVGKSIFSATPVRFYSAEQITPMSHS